MQFTAYCRELLVRGADPNSRNDERKTPLHLAVLNGDPGTATALLDHGAVVDASDEEGQTPLHKAAVQGQLDLAQEMIARGANMNAQLQVVLQAQGELGGGCSTS